MSKAHSNKGRFFEFGDKAAMDRFILLYRDLFVPYSEDTIKYEARVRDTPVTRSKNGNFYSHGHIDENRRKMLEQGYFIKGNTIRCNLTPEGMYQIWESGSFKKCRDEMSHRFYYVHESLWA